jgi:polyhydroxyalkanoate synthesis regulator phasin
MAQNDLIKRYLDAGAAFTALTQARAEAIVKDLVKAGEVQTDQAQKVVTELVERSRKNSERVLDTIRKEVRSQVSNLGLATKDDIARLERKINAAKPAAKKATPAKRAVKRTVKKASR